MRDSGMKIGSNIHLRATFYTGFISVAISQTVRKSSGYCVLTPALSVNIYMVSIDELCISNVKF